MKWQSGGIRRAWNLGLAVISNALEGKEITRFAISVFGFLTLSISSRVLILTAIEPESLSRYFDPSGALNEKIRAKAARRGLVLSFC